MSSVSIPFSSTFTRIFVMRPLTAEDTGLFENAPLIAVERRLGLVKVGRLNIGRRILLLILLGWTPIVALTLMQALISGATEQALSLFMGLETHIRYLVVAPLLVFAEAQCAPSLNAIVRHFAGSGVVPAHEHEHLEAIIASTRRSLESTTANVLVIVLAYLTMAITVWSSSPDRLPAWHKSDGALGFSPAGWWHILISLPLLLTLFFGWMRRLALWTRLLWKISRLDLRLVAAHPDGAGGLGFLRYSVRAFSIVGLAFATAAAARSVQGVMQGGDLPILNVYFNIGWLAFVALLFTSPLLVFFPALVRTWRRGIFKYGALAARMGNAFEHKWLGRETGIDESTLQQPDFSATTDLYQIVANVNAMRFIPVGLKDIGLLVGIMLLPFIPVVLLMVPIGTILAGIKGLLL